MRISQEEVLPGLGRGEGGGTSLVNLLVFGFVGVSLSCIFLTFWLGAMAVGDSALCVLIVK